MRANVCGFFSKKVEVQLAHDCSLPADVVAKEKRPQANWIHAGGHTVTAVVGVSVALLYLQPATRV